MYNWNNSIDVSERKKSDNGFGHENCSNENLYSSIRYLHIISFTITEWITQSKVYIIYYQLEKHSSNIGTKFYVSSCTKRSVTGLS